MSSEKSAAAERIQSRSSGNPDGNAAAIARLQIFAVFGAPISSRARATNHAEALPLLKDYCEKPPLFTSASTSQIAETTYCENDCFAISSRHHVVVEVPYSVDSILFLFM